MCKFLLVFLFSSILSPLNADYKATGKVKYQAKVTPGFFSFYQENIILGCDLKGKKIVSVHCKVFLQHLKDSKWEMRADHAKEWLSKKDDVTYSWPSLVIDKFEIKDGEQEFSGMLTVKKETKPIKGKITLKGLKAHGEFMVKISDYPSIGNPSFKGVGVKDDIKVSFELEAK